jgi:hypothetical protein
VRCFSISFSSSRVLRRDPFLSSQQNTRKINNYFSLGITRTYLLVPLVPLAQLIASPSVSPMIQNRQVKVRCFGPLENCETNKASMYHMYVRMFIMFIFRGWSTASTAQHSTSYRTKTQGMNKVNTTHSSLNMVITVRTHLSSK